MRGLVGLGIASVAAVLGVVLALVASGAPFEAPTEPSAGAGAATASPAASGGPSPARSPELVATFDELPIDAEPPAPWTIGRAGSVRVVALPTSVDRSARLRSSARGAPASACLPIEPGPDATAARLDVLLGEVPPTAVTLIEVRAGERNLLRLGADAAGAWAVVDGDGAPSGEGSSASPQPADEWARVEVEMAPGARSIEWRVVLDGDQGPQATTLASGNVDLSQRAGTPDALCLASPEATPAGWIAIDDVVVE